MLTVQQTLSLANAQQICSQKGSVVALVLVVLLLMSWLGIHNLRDGVLQTQISHHQSLLQQVSMSNDVAIECALQSLPTSLQKFTVALPQYLLPPFLNQTTSHQGCSPWQADQPFQIYVFEEVTAITRHQYCGYVNNATWLGSDADVFAAERFQVRAKSQAAAPQIISITDQQIWERLVAASPQQLADVGINQCID